MNCIYKLILLPVFLSLLQHQIWAQEQALPYSLDFNCQFGRVFPYEDYFTGAKGGANCFILGFNKQTFGAEEWERTYNYPSYGLSLLYQKNRQKQVGDVYALMLHYTHYFLKRKLSMKIADGLAFCTNPFDALDNQQNLFITSTFSNGFLFSLQWKEENLWQGLGWQCGLSFTHYSNGKVKLENRGLNTWFGHIGLSYAFGQKPKEFIAEGVEAELDKRLHYNLVARGGVNENRSRTGYDKLYTISFYADKRLSKKSRIQLGLDYFASDFLKHELMASGRGNYSSKRVGLFIGHDLVFDKLSIPVQLGCYVYNPTHYKKAIYERVGANYLFSKHLFMSLAVKVHLGSAEALECGLGLRL